MDSRKALPKGTVLNFRGICCEILEEIGRGSNAVVYNAVYKDEANSDYCHHILVKELFPLHTQRQITRSSDGSIYVEDAALDFFLMHKNSFESGNKVHLSLLEEYPESIGANLNTYELNGTLYTVLGVSGGASLDEIQKTAALSIRSCALRILAVLDVLEIFHSNGLVHLDIAPDNILLLGKGSNERAMLIDFNSTFKLGTQQNDENFVYSIKQGYTAPEVRIKMFKEIGFAADMYSVTAVFYRLLTGSALTSFQMIQAHAPDVTDCPCLKDEPETVKFWVQKIIRNGLQTVPKHRYGSTSAMRKDIEELIDRIDGVGITHWALWESGRRRVSRMISENPSLAFIGDSAKLFPSMVTHDGSKATALDVCIAQTKESCLLLAGGGMGKTTALLRLAISGDVRYRPNRPAVMYLSLYGWQDGDSSFIINSILNELRYQKETHTYGDAKKALAELLDSPSECERNGCPTLLLLIDGLNEITYDPKPLLDEIRRLSEMRGVRMLIASRTEESSLPLIKLNLTELQQDTVNEALSREGLLLPQSDEMQKLLRTPLMLSMYIRTGQIEGKQVTVDSPDGLMKAYFSALKEKATLDLSEETDMRWQIEAAAEMILPAIAARTDKKQRSLNETELLRIVGKCYKIIKSPAAARFFPKWIGHTKAIIGDARNAEEWYGRIIHTILWKHLGLIIRSQDGLYTVAHQIIGEFLLGLHKDTAKRIKLYYSILSSVGALCFCMLIAVGMFGYKKYIKPVPYNETYADNAMVGALSGYVKAGTQYEAMRDLLNSCADSPDYISTELEYKKEYIENGLQATNNSVVLKNLSLMLDSGKVMPWSGKPMDEKNCRRLITLASDRGEEYLEFAYVLEFTVTNDYANRYYAEQFRQLLSELIETDADIAAALYQIVCVPHLEGKYADNSATADSYTKLFSGVAMQNRHLKHGEDEKASALWLSNLEGQRTNVLSELYTCGVFHAYEEYKAGG